MFQDWEIIQAVDIGNTVICDICDADYTNSEQSGGVYGLGSKAICPDCEPRIMESAKRHNEEWAIKAHCPAGMSFADWVRNILREGNNAVTTYAEKHRS